MSELLLNERQNFARNLFGSGGSFPHLLSNARVSIQQLDANHGNVLAEYASMGMPLDLTRDQVEQLNHETALAPPLQASLTAGKLQIKLTPNELALITAQP